MYTVYFQKQAYKYRKHIQRIKKLQLNDILLMIISIYK